MRQYVVVSNISSREITVALAAVDGDVAATGGVAYALPSDKQTAVGTWIAFADRTLGLKPGQSVRVPFTVSVGATATSGDHVGGISASVPDDVTTKSVANNANLGANIRVRTRRVMAVQVIVPGPHDAALSITGVTPSVRPDGVHLSVGLANRGATLTTGTVQLDVAPDFSQKASFDNIIPGLTLAYPIKWMVKPRKGTYDATVLVTYDNGRTESWKGTFTIGAEEIEVLRDRLVEKNVPWWRENLVLLIAGAVVLLLVVVGIVAVVMRSRRRQP